MTSRANVEVGRGAVAVSGLVGLVLSRLGRLKIKGTGPFHVTWYAKNKKGGDANGSGKITPLLLSCPSRHLALPLRFIHYTRQLFVCIRNDTK